MNKFYGDIGFSVIEETAPSVFGESLVKRKYYGDIHKLSRRIYIQNQINESIDINYSISIIADAFASDNMFDIRTVEFMGKDWKVTNIEWSFPRIILTIGGLYND